MAMYPGLELVPKYTSYEVAPEVFAQVREEDTSILVAPFAGEGFCGVAGGGRTAIEIVGRVPPAARSGQMTIGISAKVSNAEESIES